MQYGFSPLDSTVANQYPDGSGFSNLQAYQAGFNPTNSAAFLHVISIVKSNTNAIVTYLGASGVLTLASHSPMYGCQCEGIQPL